MLRMIPGHTMPLRLSEILSALRSLDDDDPPPRGGAAKAALLLQDGDVIGLELFINERRLIWQVLAFLIRTSSGSRLTFESRRGFPSDWMHASLAHANRDFHHSQAG
ncbi:hypothetical protein [Nitrobacter hamburgensis]|uniref:hypothetical protein n=1 Tax=Nitrobacter hamburgensis TaxID=912 RepID=UPI0009D775A2|nr:hypothetical protein [Nitrobacter hamburgensis]